MSSVSKNSEQKYILNGVQYNAPIKWEDVTISADYVNDSIQPSLSIDEFEFPLESREAINKWISDGLTNGVGIFEGMPFLLRLFNNQPQTEDFKAFIDFTNGYKDLLQDGKVSVSIMKDRGLDNFFEQIEGTTFGYLFGIGEITFADYVNVDYVVEKKFNLIEILISSVILYLMIKELAEQVEKLADTIATISALLATSALPLPAGSIAYAIASAIIQAVYTAVLLIAIIDLGITLIETLVPPKRTHRAMTMKRLLEKVCTHFGYNLVAPISELDHVVFLPSNPNIDNKNLFGLLTSTNGAGGIPNILDYGYRCSEMFDLAKKLFNGKMAIIGNDVHLRPKNDPFWIQQSTWNLPSILLQTKEYNTEDMKAERLLTFETDISDEWTIDYYFGTSYEIRTEAKTIIRKRAVLLKGLDEVNFVCALGNRKTELNGIEKLLKALAGVIDGLTGIFGGGTNFVSKISTKIGVLKQTSNWHTVPKLLYLNNGKMPSNHRQLWNAKILYDKYHKEKSFVLDNWHNQKEVYNDVDVPFGLTDYQQLTTNPYFFYKGNVAKITKFVWTVGSDRAKISFWVRKPYTNNLKEFYIYPI